MKYHISYQFKGRCQSLGHEGFGDYIATIKGELYTEDGMVELKDDIAKTLEDNIGLINASIVILNITPLRG